MRQDIYISDNHVDYSKVVNKECGTFHELPISTTELCISTKNVTNEEVQSTPSLNIALGKTDEFRYYISRLLFKFKSVIVKCDKIFEIF